MKPTWDIFRLSKEEKAEAAKQLRSKSIVETKLTEEMQSYLDKVKWYESAIPTREGDSHVFMIEPSVDKERYPLFVNIHGGGFVRGYEKRDTVFSAYIANALGCKVIDIDYRLAPEYPFPIALNECYDVVKWAFDNAEKLELDTKRIAVGGHSAGGNLTAAIALMANQTKDFKICLQIMDYPFLDAMTDPAAKIAEGSIFPVARMKNFSACYCENEEDYGNPFHSPVCAETDQLKGLPTALIITAGKDVLRHEAEQYGLMMVHAGVKVTLKSYLESDHGFMIHGLAEFKEARELVVDALREAFRIES